MAAFTGEQLSILHEVFEKIWFRMLEIRQDIEDDWVRLEVVIKVLETKRVATLKQVNKVATAFQGACKNTDNNTIYEEKTMAAFTNEQEKILQAALGHIWTRWEEMRSEIMFDSARRSALLEVLTKKRVVTLKLVEEIATTVQNPRKSADDKNAFTIPSEISRAAFPDEQLEVLDAAVLSLRIGLDCITNGLHGHTVRGVRALRALLDVLTTKRVVTHKQVKKAVTAFHDEWSMMDPLRAIRQLYETQIAWRILEGETDAFARVLEQERKGVRQREFEGELTVRGERIR